MTSGNIGQVLKNIRKHLEERKPEPYYNEQGYVKNPTIVGDNYWPKANPYDLPREEDWRENDR